MVAFVLLPLSCLAAENRARDVPDQPISAMVIWTPYIFSFGTHIDNAVLEKIGCRYEVDNPSVASELLKLVNDAKELPYVQTEASPRFEVRNKVLIRFRKGSEISVEFGQRTPRPYLDGTWNAASVHFKKDLVEKVHQVVLATGAKQGNENGPVNCNE